jgi:tetraacyldisaccharide-1-P 4'-kinase
MMFSKSKLPILKKYYLYSLDHIYFLNILLLPFSTLYLLINLIKKYFFSNKRNNTTPVIVIGNLTVGGTGKTSLVIWLCNYFSSRKYNINGVKLTEEQFIATVRDMKLKELIDG